MNHHDPVLAIRHRRVGGSVDLPLLTVVGVLLPSLPVNDDTGVLGLRYAVEHSPPPASLIVKGQRIPLSIDGQRQLWLRVAEPEVFKILVVIPESIIKLLDGPGQVVLNLLMDESTSSCRRV